MSKFRFLLLSIALLIFSVSIGQTNLKRNCGTMNHLSDQLKNDPGLAERMNQIEQQTARFVSSRVSANSTVLIPVVFHIVYNTSAQNITDAQCIAQLNQLNLDYAKLNSDTGNIPSVFKSLSSNTNIQFCLAQRDPNGLATTGIVRKSTTTTSFGTDDKVKSTSTGGDNAWSSSSYLNIWVCNLGGGVLGYAQFPGGAASTDGVVLLYSSVGSMVNPGTASPYNLGRTATHEVGHWLNLRHIWGDANCGNDLVGDTPTQQTSNFGCPTFPHITCSNGSNGDMFMNYMDYVDDGCMNMFSAGQTSRMASLFVSGGARVSLLSSAGCQPVSNSCNTPTGLNASSITSNSAILGWTAVSGALSYNLQYRGVGDTNWILTSSSSNSVSVSSLSASKNYEFQVRTVCTSGNTAYSASGTFTTLAVVPSCVNAFEANETQGTAATVSNNVNISAGIGSATDIDYFKFSTTSTSNLNITLSTLPADFDIVLYNSSGTQIGSSSAAGTSNESIVLSNQLAGTYYIKILGYSGAFSTSNCYTLFVGVTAAPLAAPAAPSYITITPLSINICGAKKYRYTAPALPVATNSNVAATGYVWSFTGTLGTNASIDSGNINSQAITVTYTSNAAANTGDSVKLYYTSSAGNSFPTAVKLTNTLLTAPASPASISITPLSTDKCGAKKYRYSAPALSTATNTAMAATGYVWSFTGTLGANASIDSGNINSQVITVTYTSNAAANTGDSVRVLFTSGCGNTANKSVKLTNTLLSAPAAPSAITITAITTNVCNAKRYRYAAPALTSASTTTMAATGYVWSFTGTLGSNASIDSGNINSQVITVTYTSNAAANTGDSVRVLFTSGCGNSSNKSMKLTNTNLTLSTAPSSISIVLVKDSCAYRIYRYSAPALPSATTTQPSASGYLWSFTGTLGANATIDSGTINSQILRMRYSSNNGAFTGDSARVAFTSACGNSPNKSVKLTNIAKSCRMSAPYSNLKNNSTIVNNNTSLFSSINVYPNPSKNDFNINLSYLNGTETTIKIYDIQNRMIKDIHSSTDHLLKFGADLKPGMYILEIITGNTSQKTKLLKL